MCPTLQRFCFRNCDQLEMLEKKIKKNRPIKFENFLPVATKLHDPRNTKSVIPLL